MESKYLQIGSGRGGGDDVMSMVQLGGPLGVVRHVVYGRVVVSLPLVCIINIEVSQVCYRQLVEYI